MGRSKSRIRITLALLGLLLPGAKLIWTAGHIETGWGSLTLKGYDAAFGWMDREIPVHQRSTVQQANFWLLEANRIIQQSPPSAELSMGAAWVLNSPSPGFVLQYRNHSDLEHRLVGIEPPLSLPRDFDLSTIKDSGTSNGD